MKNGYAQRVMLINYEKKYFSFCYDILQCLKNCFKYFLCVKEEKFFVESEIVKMIKNFKGWKSKNFSKITFWKF